VDAQQVSSHVFLSHAVASILTFTVAGLALPWNLCPLSSVQWLATFLSSRVGKVTWAKKAQG
jgi:hypothetical protein